MRFKALRSKGFTLIELMIALVIISILATIAFPAYQDSVRKSRRADAKVALERAATMQEQFFFANNVYSSNVNEIGGSGGALSSPEGLYSISVAVNNGRYTLTATAASGKAQIDDTPCRSFSLNSLGQKTSKNSNGGVSTDCW